MESPHPRVWGVLFGLAGLALLIALCGDAVGPRRLAAMRARAAELEAKQAAAKAAVNAAYERSGGDWDAVREAARRADWLSGEEWAELNAIRERIEKLESFRQAQGGPPPASSDDGTGATSPARDEPSGE